MQMLSLVFANAAEFNYPKAFPGRSPVDLPLEAVISLALEEQDPMQLIKRANWMWYAPNAELLGSELKCLDLSILPMLAVPLIASKPFDYLACLLSVYTT